MSKTIAELLRNYNELQNLDGSNPASPDQADALEDLIAVRADIERALRNVHLTQEERDVLGAFFLVEPVAPERDRPNRAGNTSGRPRGGLTQSRVAQLMLDTQKSQNAKNIALSRTLHRIYAKLGEYLGAEYQ